MNAEIQFHIDAHAEDLMRSGMPREEALRQARVALGGVEQAREECRDAVGIRFVENLAQDARFGLRTLRKNPGFTAVAVLTLALGIGANAAIFSVVNAVLLRMLPVKNPQQLVLFTWQADKKWPPNWAQSGNDEKYSFSYPAFAQLERQNTVLSETFAFVPQSLTISRNGDATSADGEMVTGNYFSGLGVTPLAGRAIAEADEQPGAPRVAVIGQAYWTTRFARDPGAIGSIMLLNGLPFTIVGIMPSSFSSETPGERADLWIAFDDEPTLRLRNQQPYGSDSVYTARNWLCLNVMGRLKPGVSLEQAQSQLDVLFRRFVTQDWNPPRTQDVPGFLLTPAAKGLPYLRALVGQPLLLLMGAVSLVLLIACANVATLLLARAAARSKEVSVRLAMGATRGRLIRQLLTESVMLSLPGGALGFLFALLGTRALVTVPAQGPFAIFVSLDPDVRVFFFTLGASLLTGLVFGLAPALRASRFDLALAMKDSGADLFARRERHRLGQTLVVGQIAASLTLMVAAGLLLRTLINRAHTDFGFNQDRLLTFALDPTRDNYHGDGLIRFYSELLARIQTLPGVEATTVMEFIPFESSSNNTRVTIPGLGSATTYRPMRWQTVGPNFFSTMRIPIVLGRGIEQSDTAAARKVVVIDQTMAKAFFGDKNPIGQLISHSTDAKSDDQWEVVGVARPAELTDVHSDLRSKAYFSYEQYPEALGRMAFEVRFKGGAADLISQIRGTVREADANLPLLSLETQNDIRDDALTGERILARLSALFGILALALSMIGLYGTIAYAVSRRTHEIGIRMALGAAPAEILRMTVGQGTRLAGLGIMIGTIASLGVTRLLRSLIFGVTPTDPLTFVAVPIVLLVVAIAACYIPARRAMRVDPMSALRCE